MTNAVIQLLCHQIGWKIYGPRGRGVTLGGLVPITLDNSLVVWRVSGFEKLYVNISQNHDGMTPSINQD